MVRAQLEAANMPVEEAPDDEDVRQSYNFAPGYHGIVYRADVPDYGAGSRHHKYGDADGEDEDGTQDTSKEVESEVKETKYKMQAMKWGMHRSPCLTSSSSDSLTRTHTILDKA